MLHTLDVASVCLYGRGIRQLIIILETTEHFNILYISRILVSDIVWLFFYPIFRKLFETRGFHSFIVMLYRYIYIEFNARIYFLMVHSDIKCKRTQRSMDQFHTICAYHLDELF